MLFMTAQRTEWSQVRSGCPVESKVAHQSLFKFSSECLEVLLKKNFFLTSEYLINDYYPKTSIDTEVIVRNVAADIKRSQDYLVFQVKKRETHGQFP